jgi:hypothetical protein
VGSQVPSIPEVTEDDLPVESMHWTVGEHYERDEELRVGDARQFDGDLRRIFARIADAPAGETARDFLARHEGELVARLSYWAGVGPAAVRSLIRALGQRAASLELRVAGLDAATLIELTAFGTAVLLHWQYTRVVDAHPPATDQ